MTGEARFEAIRRLLEKAGWALARIRSSHHIFTKPGEDPISIPVHHGRIKACYVRRIEKILKREGG